MSSYDSAPGCTIIFFASLDMSISIQLFKYAYAMYDIMTRWTNDIATDI